MATRMINVNEVVGNKQNPTKIHTWDLWKEGNFIFVKSHSKANGESLYKFPNEEGSIYLFNSTQKKYAYFRTKKFQDFLNKYKIDFVKKEEPNKTYYITPTDRVEYKIYTDGKIIEKWNDLTERIAIIEEATFVIIKEIWTRAMGYRKHLITLEKDIFKLKDKLDYITKKEKEDNTITIQIIKRKDWDNDIYYYVCLKNGEHIVNIEENEFKDLDKMKKYILSLNSIYHYSHIYDFMVEEIKFEYINETNGGGMKIEELQNEIKNKEDKK